MVFSVAAMSAVHQPVEQRAGEQQQIRQDAEEMGPMLG